MEEFFWVKMRFEVEEFFWRAKTKKNLEIDAHGEGRKTKTKSSKGVNFEDFIMSRGVNWVLSLFLICSLPIKS